MHSIKAWLALLAVVSVCMATISGRVTNSSGTVAIFGAVVQLESGGNPVTTDVNGNFTISVGTIGVSNQIGQTSMHTLYASVQGGFLRVNVVKKSVVEITVYDLSGKALLAVKQTMDAGAHTLGLPTTGKGVYLYNVKADNAEVVLKGSTIGGVARGVGITTDLSQVKNALSKKTKVTAKIDDVIAVTKDGYLNYRSVIYNSDTSGVAIKMISSAGTMTDVDGNVYQTVRIGNQEWTVENLRTTRYRDGTLIPFDTSVNTWTDTTPKYCFYNNTANVNSIKKFGALYNGYVIAQSNSKKIAPVGWHVPTDSEWTTLETSLIANGYNWDGTTTGKKIAKALAGQTDWTTDTSQGAIGNNLANNNGSGFSAFGGGFRNNNDGRFYDVGQCCYWWCATDYNMYKYHANYRLFVNSIDYVYRDAIDKCCGLSVRLVRD